VDQVGLRSDLQSRTALTAACETRPRRGMPSLQAAADHTAYNAS